MKRLLPGLLLPGVLTGALAQTPTVRTNDLKPVSGEGARASVHAPFATGECQLCHQNNDPGNPGPVAVRGNALCLECHEEFSQIMARKFTHVAAVTNCLSCHNPHNSDEGKLLVENTLALCLGCHAAIKKLALESSVKHGALTEGARCVACHNPHAANVEHLLIQLPKELCLSCHNRDDVRDHQGKKLTNMKKLLEENPQHHGPVAAGDCSACHNPHGYQYFRLLNHEYPEDFYSSYDPKLYALCFECHEEKEFTLPETDKLTRFRDGKRNLHYLHVNKEDLGRTCRACHEVHASKQAHQIRDWVPYGNSGWLLKINYTRTPTGGFCLKTCHGERSYNNNGGETHQKE